MSNTQLTLEEDRYLLDASIDIVELENFTLEGIGATLIMKATDENFLSICDSKKITIQKLRATHIEPTGSMLMRWCGKL